MPLGFITCCSRSISEVSANIQRVTVIKWGRKSHTRFVCLKKFFGDPSDVVKTVCSKKNCSTMLHAFGFLVALFTLDKSTDICASQMWSWKFSDSVASKQTLTGWSCRQTFLHCESVSKEKILRAGVQIRTCYWLTHKQTRFTLAQHTLQAPEHPLLTLTQLWAPVTLAPTTQQWAPKFSSFSWEHENFV